MSGSQQVQWVKDIFSTVTGKYDFLNHLLSLRRDIAWRRRCVEKMRFPMTRRLLDVATGTGDLAIEAVRRHPGIEAVGLDFVREMLEVGRRKAEMKGYGRCIRLLEADALQMPFRDNAFDVVAVAFGIRNIPEKIHALKEMRRVVVPGGQVLVLEFTLPKTPFFKPLYRVYLNALLPFLARFFSPNPGAYTYLADSVMNFPGPEAFKVLMKEAGLVRLSAYPLTLGVTWLYLGHKPG